MASNSSIGFLTSSEIDFTTLKQSFQLFLSQQTLFKDWNLDGPNIGVLLDVLTYNTTLNSLYLNLVGSEMFLDSAQLRESIISHSKELNYCSGSRTSAFVEMTVSLTGNSIPGVVVLPTGFAVSGKGSNGSSLQFITETPTVLTSENNWTANVNFYEGRLITETFVSNSAANTSSMYNLESANVDTTSITVNVQTSTSDTSNSDWTFSDGLTGVSGNTEVWFLQGYKDNYYQIVFGNGKIGSALSPGNIVTATYRETSGPGGNGIKTFAPLSNTNITGVSVLLGQISAQSSGGSERETDESIKFASPRFFQTQGRAISPPDYKYLISNKFPQFLTVNAYGGEDATPHKMYGTVLVSGKLAGLDFVPQTLADSVTNYLAPLLPLGLTSQFVQPDIYDIQLTCDVVYNPLKTSLVYQELEELVVNEILTYDANNLESFGASFWSTQLTNLISEVDPSVMSVEIISYISKSYQPILNVSQGYSFNFNNPLYYPFTSPTVYPFNFTPVFQSTPFYYKSTLALIQDNGLGALNIVAFSNNSTVLSANIGSVSYTNGQVSISPFVIDSLASGFNTLDFVAKTDSDDIIAAPSQIFTITSNDISLSLTSYAE